MDFGNAGILWSFRSTGLISFSCRRTVSRLWCAAALWA